MIHGLKHEEPEDDVSRALLHQAAFPGLQLLAVLLSRTAFNNNFTWDTRALSKVAGVLSFTCIACQGCRITDRQRISASSLQSQKQTCEQQLEGQTRTLSCQLSEDPCTILHELLRRCRQEMCSSTYARLFGQAPSSLGIVQCRSCLPLTTWRPPW